MLPKLIVALLAFAGNMMIWWYGGFTGKLPSKGEYLGISYDSPFVRAVVTQFEYLWILVIINILFSFMFSLGFESFKNFLTLAVIWLAMGPISALVYNTIVLKQRVNWVEILGLLFVLVGSICVSANKEILAVFKK